MNDFILMIDDFLSSFERYFKNVVFIFKN